MATHTQRSTIFQERLDVPFDIYEPLFADLFASEKYNEWMTTEHTWQLRIIGPPGCGKTTVSALAVRRLNDRFFGRNVRVASIFFQRMTRVGGNDFLRDLLQSIYGQLAGREASPGSENEEPNHQHAGARNAELQGLRASIQQTVKSLDQSFLILDDIDLLPSSVLASVEAELSLMQCPALSILVTSRTPHSYDPDDPECDFHGAGVSIGVYWCCKRCNPEGDEFVGEDAEVFCRVCKDSGKKCRKCGLTDMFYEPYTYVMYLMTFLNEFPEFVAHELERAHGDLGLESDCEDKPPLSSLGRVLDRTKPTDARKIWDDIVQEAKCNITLAKARLDSRLNAQSTEEFGHRGDRLPDNILALFDAAVERVGKSDQEDSELGLNAIVGAALLFNGQDFYKLEDWLIARGLLDSGDSDDSDDSDDPDSSEDNMLRVLRASGGLLMPDYGHEARIRTYHVLFYTYVKENYNETLFRLRPLEDESRRD